MFDESAAVVVFEGEEAAAFIEALESGTASAEYLREADELFARIFSPEPANRLFRLRRELDLGSPEPRDGARSSADVIHADRDR